GARSGSCVGGRARLRLERRQQATVVEVAEALSACAHEELRDDASQRERNAERPGGVERDAHVLVVQVDPEPGGEATLVQACALELEHAAAGEASLQNGEGGVDVDT